MSSSYMGAMGVPGPIGMYGRSSRNRGNGGGFRAGGMDSYDESHSLLMELSTQVSFYSFLGVAGLSKLIFLTLQFNRNLQYKVVLKSYRVLAWLKDWDSK